MSLYFSDRNQTEAPGTHERWHIAPEGEGPYSCESYESRDEAIAAGIEGFRGAPFFVAREAPWWPRVDEEDVLDQARFQAYDHAGEWSAHWLAHIPQEQLDELRNLLQSVFDWWLWTNGLVPDFFVVEDAEKVFPSVMSDGTNGVTMRAVPAPGRRWLETPDGGYRMQDPCAGSQQRTGDSQEMGR